MRGKFEKQTGLFCLINLEELVPEDHPARQVKRMCKQVLVEMSTVFEQMYASDGWPSVPPERLLMGWTWNALRSTKCRRCFSPKWWSWRGVTDG